MAKVLIHSALLCECQNLINYYKLKQNKSITKFKLFENNNIIIAVSGIGKDNTLHTLEYIFKNYEISKAINIGIAGCKDTSIPIGELFCISHRLPNIENTTLSTFDNPLDDKSLLKTTLVDMEASYFEQISKKYVNEIYVLKVVSDYLDTKILKKPFVIELMIKSFKKWEYLI